MFKTLWSKDPGELAQVAASKQFGQGPWPWVGLRIISHDLVQDRSGNQYLIYSRGLYPYQGWNLVHLQSLKEISIAALSPLAKTTGLGIVGFCLLAGLTVYYLNRKARTEIRRRASVEEDLRLAKEQLSQYSRDLERQVRQRTREITGFLQHTPAVVYLKDPSGKYVLVNSRWEELWGMSNAQVSGKTVFDVFPTQAAELFRRNDLQVLTSKRPYQSEEPFPVGDKIYTYLSVRFPVLDGSGKVIRLCGISIDITDLKKAQDRLRRLPGDILESQEKERTAIARELHDELGQVLTALRIDAVWLRQRLSDTDSKGTARAANMCDIIDTTISEVRNIATRLRPAVLDDLGLIDALEWFTSDFERRTGVTCLFNHNGPVPDDQFQAIAAYRVAQEAITNVTRHSGANHVEVTVAVGDDKLVLTVQDNGRGFDPGLTPHSGGIGLAGMRERAKLAGGELHMESSPGGGATVQLVLPILPPDQES